MVDYEERLYAAGKIKGSRFIKREGRPSDEAVLSGRMVDRVVRPLFNGRIRNDIQVVLTILSVDQENDPDFCSVIGASAALAVSDIPWDGPVGAVRMARVNGSFIVNPTYQEREKSLYDIIVTGKGKGKVNMIEAEGKEVPEAEIIEAIESAENYLEELVKFQNEIVSQVGKKKRKVKIFQAEEEKENEIREFLAGKLEECVFGKDKALLEEKMEKLKKELQDFAKERLQEDLLEVANLVLEEEIEALMKKNILEKEMRPDGRKPDELREISVEVGILPRTHGSGLFNRGTTQVLTVATLGAPGDEQTLDGMEEEGTKRFMHHYTFPPYSVGEVSPLRGPGRREIGHGALAEKAIKPLIPEKENFLIP